MLVWFLVLGKLNTMDWLASYNLLNGAEKTCVLCNEKEECIQHLFFSCKYAWQLWCSCLSKWKVDWVMPTDPRSAFESWIDVRLSKNEKKKWCVCFFTVVWSVWEAKNKIVFEKRPFSTDKCKLMFWHSWKLWSKTWCS